jgi:hypothetical protein
MRGVIAQSGKGELKRRRVWGFPNRQSACYGRRNASTDERDCSMAEEEPLLVSPPTQDVAVHVSDYMRFTKLLKWGAIVCLIIGLVWLLIVKAYW